MFACVAVVSLTACTGPDSEIVPAEVQWMEWPAEVLASEAFTVRLAGFGVGCREVLRFDPGTTVDNSAVTFEPFFLVSRQQNICPLDAPTPTPADRSSIIAPFFDIRAPVPALKPDLSRSYEIRAAANVSVQNALPAALPVRTFGQIVVRSDSADESRTDAAGFAYAQRDAADCVTIFVGIQQLYVVENPPDTATFWSAFVRGYLYQPAVPVCGADTVFHLISRE